MRMHAWFYLIFVAFIFNITVICKEFVVCTGNLLGTLLLVVETGTFESEHACMRKAIYVARSTCTWCG